MQADRGSRTPQGLSHQTAQAQNLARVQAGCSLSFDSKNANPEILLKEYVSEGNLWPHETLRAPSRHPPLFSPTPTAPQTPTAHPGEARIIRCLLQREPEAERNAVMGEAGRGSSLQIRLLPTLEGLTGYLPPRQGPPRITSNPGKPLPTGLKAQQKKV